MFYTKRDTSDDADETFWQALKATYLKLEEKEPAPVKTQQRRD